ncbi:hypothetical protein M3225_00005 [Priestia aryabhattai]|nr:hypothetical protein [Priestia aryabhattai]MCM3768876.1 hypothetical protein [Priestia aryabhattai]
MDNERSFVFGRERTFFILEVLSMDYGQLPNRVIIYIDMKSFFGARR